MNLIEFTDCIQHPSKVTEDQTKKLEGILKEYPYFQAAHFLLLNGLKNQNSFKYNNTLKKIAAYTTDRSVLFNNIANKEYVFIEELTDQNEVEVKEVQIIKAPPIEVNSTEKTPNTKIEDLPIGKPLQFDNNETLSFNQWLKITSAKPISRKESQKSTANSIKKELKNEMSNFDLIDNFISLNKKLKPSLSEYNNDISKESVLENEHLMTETLAHVYLEQKKYEKAITAFTVLSLKYPEKSSFFANRIKAIKIIQNK